MDNKITYDTRHLIGQGRTAPLFPVKKKYLYFNFASDGPLPIPARNVICDSVTEKSEKGLMPVPKQIAVYEELRQELSVLFNSEPEHFAFTKSTSEGVLLALLALDLKSDENYIVAEDAFPTTVRMMENNCKGQMRKVTMNSDIPLIDQVKNVIDDKTRAFVLDWVHYFSGAVLDLPAIVALAKEKGIFTVIDGIQGAGAMKLELDDSGIDFFVTGAHKWLLSPQGSGFIYVSPKVWERIPRKSFGWLGYDWRDFSDFNIEPELRPGATVMEYGTRSYTAAAGMRECLRVINSFGIVNIEKHNQALRRYFIDAIIQKGYKVFDPPYKNFSSIVSFRTGEYGNTRELLKILEQNGVVLSFRNHHIRASFHFVNHLEEVEKLVRML